MAKPEVVKVAETDAPAVETNTADKPLLVKPVEETVPISKPSAFSLDKFKSKRAAAVANVETLQTSLPHHKISEARDFVRLHPDEETYWSDELCFVNVPIKGQKRDTLHLIGEDLALHYLPSGKILRFRLVLATKPSTCFSSVTFQHGTKTTIGTPAIYALASKPKPYGCRRPVAKRKESKPTRLIWLATTTPSLNRSGRNNRLPI
jgi:hypothetical protein